MKALVLEDYNKLVFKDFPEPRIKPDEVLVRVKACGICGSDVHGIDGSTGRRIPPIIMGHEASGEIVETGTEVKGWAIGDRVTFDSTVYPLNDWYTLKGMYNLSNNREVLGVAAKEFRRHGAFAEYVAIPTHILYKIPDNVSFEEAAMVEPVAVAAHAVKLSQLSLGGSVLVVGAGMVGCFVIKLLQLAGADKIVAADTDPSKAVLAKQYGATHFVNPLENDLTKLILKETNGRGSDLAIEVVGNTAALNTAISNVRKGGSVTLIGNLSQKVEIPFQQIVTRQISLQGSCAICGEYEEVLSLMQNGKVDVKPMISKVAPLSEGAEWFKRLYNKREGLNKIILIP